MQNELSNEIKRYNFDEGDLTSYPSIQENENGNYVSYEDHEEIVNSLKDEKEETTTCECGEVYPLKYYTSDEEGCESCPKCVRSFLEGELTSLKKQIETMREACSNCEIFLSSLIRESVKSENLTSLRNQLVEALKKGEIDNG